MVMVCRSCGHKFHTDFKLSVDGAGTTRTENDIRDQHENCRRTQTDEAKTLTAKLSGKDLCLLRGDRCLFQNLKDYHLHFSFH